MQQIDFVYHDMVDKVYVYERFDIALNLRPIMQLFVYTERPQTVVTFMN